MIVLGALVALLAVGPIAQDQAYHGFADRRAWLGVPSFLDVASNLPFLVVGLLGLRTVRRQWARLPTRWGWLAFFVGVTAVSAGSAYYHWAPDDATLTWDRLPMTAGFMGLFVALLAEYVGPRLERALIPALILGAFSVVTWRVTGDLRLYIWVQLVPLVTIPAVMLLFPARYSHASLLLLGLGCYVLAKGAELADQAIFDVDGGLVSGHTLKHLLAAGGPYCIHRMLVSRCQRAQAPEGADAAA